jgi:adenylosuccinate synthase
LAKRIILLSGPVASGKSTLGLLLADRYRVQHVKTRQIIRTKFPKVEQERGALQKAGDRLDRDTKGAWVATEVSRLAAEIEEEAVILVDSVRTADQIRALREAFGPRVVHMHLSAPDEVLEQRYLERQGPTREFTTYAELVRNRTEAGIGKLAQIADVVIDTKLSSKTDVLVRAASHLGFYGRSYARLVDVLIGGAYGSEGKGHIASYLAREYDYLVRVGGPNAGHQVYERPSPYIHHQLPSGTRQTEARLVIAPGAVIEVGSLVKEINQCDVSVDRLSIDPRAMIIDARDVAFEEKTLKPWIGSTAQGVGAATARRIMRGALKPGLARGTKLGQVRLAGHIPQLQPWVKDTREVLDDAFFAGRRVLVEGTQGAGLSLYHGEYPHVTSRDTTVAGCLSEAGIAPSRLRKIVMVCRTYPIRVQNPDQKGMTSGPMTRELNWEEIAERSGQSVEELKERERTSTTRRQRRVMEFDWTLLRRAASLNGPTDIALTFADYLSPKNARARRFEQLTPDTINFIQEIERVAAAPVSLISTRFHYRSIIDRRAW